MSDKEAIVKMHELITRLKWEITKKDDSGERLNGHEVIGPLIEIQGKIEEYLSVGRQIE
ncbi:hypothetical protein D3C71_1851300 [compost metagenome]